MTPGGLVKSSGFRSFLGTQFLGALNDNLYKMLVSLAALSLAAAQGESSYLSLAQAVFILPFFLFSGYAGHLADAFSKRTVLVAAKVFEIAVIGMAMVAFYLQDIHFMLGVLFLMALQSTFFSPAKYGIVPEILPDQELSRGNALLNMTTFVAIILGTAAGGFLYARWHDRLWTLGPLLIVVAVAGVLSSLGIPKVFASDAGRRFHANPWAEVAGGIRALYADRRLWLANLGIAYFWFLGAFLQIAILLLGKEALQATDSQNGMLIASLAVGIGLGSMAAGRLSGDRVELGLVPLGAIGMGVFSLLLAGAPPSFSRAAVAMVLLGCAGGLYIVPLEAYLQQRSSPEQRGRIFAANNFLTTGGILLASGVTWLMRDVLSFSPGRIIAIAGVFTLLATAYILKLLPDVLVRFLLWLFTHTIYRIRIVGREHVPSHGPALLVCNHVSLVDGFLVGACLQRFVRFLVYGPYYERKVLGWGMRLMKAIPVQAGNSRKVLESLQRAREELRQGHVVCIFPEGSISRTGNLLPFKRGFEKIVEGLSVPVIPVHLDGVWGSIFSFAGGRLFAKWPTRLPYPVTVSFGRPLPPTAKAHELREAVMELGAEAVRHRRAARDLLHLRFVRTAKRRWFSFCMADSSGKKLTYGKALIGSLALARRIRRRCQDERMVGLLLPSSVGGALANIAVLLAGKVPVNLNFTAGPAAMRAAIEQCGIKTVLSSQVFLSKAKLEPPAGTVFLEQVLRGITGLEKLRAALAACLLPTCWLGRLHSRRRIDPQALATVIFSSGSTGEPKGVMLSHHNILSNIESIGQVFSLAPTDRVMSVLPFFHSFGFTVTLWLPLVNGLGAVFHPNPLDAQTIGRMVARHRATVIASTPTFYGSYLRKCAAEDFSSLRLALVGAEKLRQRLADAFAEKFSLVLLEGYGVTEMAPVIAVNRPDVAGKGLRQLGRQAGTVGHPVPGVAAKVVDLDSGEPLPPNAEGMLLVKGPNQMLGYLGRSEKSAGVLRDGWYVTGDIGRIDHDGFITITDRLSRFSKIGGEMVPHVKVEEIAAERLAEGACAVTAAPDEQKGERLVVFHTDAGLSPDELWRRLSASGLPKLWIPKRENLHYVEEIPTLGTGKLDLRRLRAMARDLCQAAVAV